MFKKYVGLDFLDVLIHVGVSIAAAVLLASIAPNEEAGVAIAFGASLVVLAWRRKRALAAAREYSTGEVQETERILDLEARVADLEQAQGRVLELEERLDFTERLLTRHAEAGRLSAGRED